MASSRAIEAAKAFVRIFADDSQLRKTLAGLQDKMQTVAAGAAKIGGGLMGASAAGLAPLTAAVFSFSDAGGQLDDMSQQTGVAGETLSQLGYAAKLSGADLEGLGKAFLNQGKLIKAARDNSAGAIDTLNKLGLTVSDLEGLSPEQHFLKMAEALSRIDEPGTRAALAMEAFGKSGAQLLPMLNSGAAGISGLMREADALGVTLSDEQVSAAAEFGDAWDRVKSVAGGVTNQIGAALAPTLTTLLNAVANNAAAVVHWIRANTGLITGLATGLVLIGALGAAFVTAGAAIAGLSAGLSLILSPLGLVIGLAASLGAVFVSSAGNASAALQWLQETFGPLWDRAKQAFDAIKNALTGGDWSLAAQVLWLTLKKEFMSGTQGILSEWYVWKKTFLDVFADAMSGMRKMWATAQNSVASGIVSLMGMVDSSINVDDVKATLEEDFQRRMQAAAAQDRQAQVERDNQFEKNITGINTDLAEVQKQWQAAVAEANGMAADGTIAPPSDRFAQLMEEAQTGTFTKMASTPAKAPPAADLRSLSGQSQLVGILNGTGTVQDRQLKTMMQVQQGIASLNRLTERQSRAVNV